MRRGCLRARALIWRDVTRSHMAIECVCVCEHQRSRHSHVTDEIHNIAEATTTNTNIATVANDIMRQVT